MSAFSSRRIRAAFFAALSCVALPPASAAATNAVAGLIDRLLPGRLQDFTIETMPASAGENAFEVEARDGKIVLRGNCALSQAVALNWYLKHDALVDVSWYADNPIDAPARLPLPKETIARRTKVKNRFFLNYCTFGYSFPWWRWRDWERLIDWMALNGINLPLAQGANEAVWQKVWRSYGLTDQEIRGGYFSGPAYLPWNRMGNLDGWDGPLPQSYIDGQFALTKRILARERSFGMKPILPAFAGHVPAALRRVRPETKLTRLHWGGVSTYFIAPRDPLFRELEVTFLREQAKELGMDHYYGTDPFNEMTPPSWEPGYLADVSKTIYDSMAQADPNAVWVQMAWTFRGKNWTDPRLKAMIRAVPQGRMILLDYFCERDELWRRTQFFGAPFIWNYLGNFGGTTVMHGPINLINDRLTATMNDPALTNFVGIGSTLEGLSDQSMYEFLFDRAWEGAQCDTTNWLRVQARCRAGMADPAVESAYVTFWLKGLVGADERGGDSSYHGGGDSFTMVPHLTSGSKRGRSAAIYPAASLASAWKEMLKASPEARKHDGYRADLFDVTRLALTTVGDRLRREMFAAYKRKDAVAFKQLETQFLELGHDLDRFLSTRPNYRFGKWIADARAWGRNDAEADYYERDARTIVTTWFGKNHGLNDYASRDWSGLLDGYYLGRWKMYLDAYSRALGAGVKPDSKIDQRVADFEWQWARTVGGKFSSEPPADCYSMSRALFKKYGRSPISAKH